MATFAALNVEPESDTEDEVDDTKEIQVEEALKLYQNALKLHSQGPAFYEDAKEAYEALFASEIFSYPESQSEAKRLANQPDPDDSEAEDYDLLLPDAPLSGVDTAPNTLPQILYLSYKNRGQFLIECLLNQLRGSSDSGGNEAELGTRPSGDVSLILRNSQEGRSTALEGLTSFAEALDRDDTDPDLWRRTARLSGVLGSRRLVRFCLEAILSNRAEEIHFGANRESLDQEYAREDLLNLVAKVQDTMAEELFKLNLKGRKRMSYASKALLNPFPGLEDSTNYPDLTKPRSQEPRSLLLLEKTWAGLGKAILAQKKSDNADSADPPFGVGYMIIMPGGEGSRSSVDSDGRKARTLIAAETLIKSRSSQSQISPIKPSAYQEGSAIMDDPIVESPSIQKLQSSAANNSGNLSESTPTRTESSNRTDSRLHLKRNSESAGLNEHEGVRSRSKRLRARAEVLDDELDPKDLLKHYEEQVQPNIEADQRLFDSLNAICSTVAPLDMITATDLRHVIQPDESMAASSSPLLSRRRYLQDLRDNLLRWDLNKSNLLVRGTGSGASVTLLRGGDDSGLTAFLEHSKPSSKSQLLEKSQLVSQGLSRFAANSNRAWKNLDQLSLAWVEAILTQPGERNVGIDANRSEQTSKYLEYIWPAQLKDLVTDLLVDQDFSIYPSLEFRLFDAMDTANNLAGTEISDTPLLELILTVFELHLDIYGKMTQANSKVDQPSRTMQKDRLHRWASLSSHAINILSNASESKTYAKPLVFRYLWSTVIHVSLVESTSREHILLCLRDLKTILEDTKCPPIRLPNNSIMPEISADAAEREISRLTTMDFFLSIFDPNTESPVTVIESLEPILMGQSKEENRVRRTASKSPPRDARTGIETENGSRENSEERIATPPEISQEQNPPISDFLKRMNASLRLSLWYRLKTAYESIDYPPMVFLCYVRSIKIILAELNRHDYLKEDEEDRKANLTVWIRNLGDLTSNLLDLAQSSSIALDCLDEDHLLLALRSCAEVAQLFHLFALWEDSVRIGQNQSPAQPSGGAIAYKSAMSFLREMQPKIWTLLYYLLKELISQNQALISNSAENNIEYLCAVHNTFGLREYCKLGKKAFLKFAKTELLQGPQSDETESEVLQLLYDLYGLKICQNNTDVADHGCTADQIDRSTAIEVIDFVMMQAKKMNIKDVLKSDMKVATEKMQAIIGIPRSSSLHQLFNRRITVNRLKAPINPMDLYRSLRGIGGLTGMPVKTEFAMIARKKWFFLLGHILLAKYRSAKRTSPDNSDDLDDALTFLKMDLDFDTESWETWFRLAQTYDAKIEEDTTWTADKINDTKSDLVSMQKSSIHCYSMAIAIAIRNADESFNTAAKLSDLYTNFGDRIYASSRPPFSMQAFSLKDNERICDGPIKGHYKREPFGEFKQQAAWTFAGELYRLALVEKPDYWMNWYMLGKCYWKLFKHATASVDHQQQALKAFIRAVECVPERREGRHAENQPILEPHYKLVSVVHKLVHGGHINPNAGSEILSTSSHARKVKLDEEESWDSYILKVLKCLRSADKASWHHRIIARAAHILYDDNPDDPASAHAAKHELTQQTFTKTMSFQVWRPEFERAGRHFVYTTRYVRFFIQILHQIRDRASIEALGKRVRKKQAEFVDHALVWNDICTAHLKLLRYQGQIPEGHEDSVFKMLLPYDVFMVNANRLEEWAHSPLSAGDQNLEILRETIELKKLNGTLMKTPLIDDLIGDTYARIYEKVAPGLEMKAGEAENRERMRIERMLMSSDLMSDNANGTPAPDEQPSAPTKLKSIGRTEVRRRAEALVAQPNALNPPQRGRRGAAATSATVGTKGQPSGTSGTTNKLSVPKAEPSPKEAPVSAPASAPGSVHDSADDESGLSDIEEGNEEEKEADEEDEEANAEEEEEAKQGKAAASLLFPRLAVPKDDTDKNSETMSINEGNEES